MNKNEILTASLRRLMSVYFESQKYYKKPLTPKQQEDCVKAIEDNRETDNLIRKYFLIKN